MNLPFTIDLAGKTAVITGAGGVLCSTFAKALAQCGAKIALLDINLEAAALIEKEINDAGGTAKAYQANVLDRNLMDSVANQVEAEIGSCDILINGAGGNSPRATTDKEYFVFDDLDENSRNFFSLDSKDVGFVFDLNFLGTLIPTQSFAKQMVNGGTVLNISSMNAFTPLTKIPAYSGAKAAISNFTQWLAVYFSKAGIRVNAIAPGFFVTGQNEKMLFNEDGTRTDRTEKILSGTPMDRFGKPEELLGGVLYLLSEEASGFVTGVVLPIDGGFAAYSGV